MTEQFMAGLACGLAEIHRMHGEATMVCDVLRGFGVTLADLRRANVEDYDIVVIRACLAHGNADDRAQLAGC